MSPNPSRRTPGSLRRPAATAPHDFPPGVAAPARRALSAAGYTQLAQLAGVPAAQLASLHGMGPRALAAIAAALAAQGKRLG